MVNAAFYPLLLIFSPSILIALSSICLFQFTQGFKAFIMVSKEVKGNQVWKFVQPHCHQLGLVLESVLGPAQKFSPSTTHVVLVALMLGMIICAERIRTAILSSKIKVVRK
ncbi:hypothetical protein CYMTET_49409 [Cymbomonas tetramitiformis]|uniref:Uncharacterized protein n=1 Tax=Cymbomonas tetramitiformis TaxID=36881 RepID=A0AAE0BRG7_9CHLO|nr:hypothetical protein CYMTET_49409 [Cymbomonas tetramitiformis]